MSDRSDSADRSEIADLVHAYALHIRHGEPAEAAALFTADGAFEVRDFDPLSGGKPAVRSRVEGREAVAGYVGNSTRGVRMVPLIHNLIVTLAGDRATASSLMVGRVWPTDNEVLGEYADSFRRENGRWAFSERVYTIWTKPAS